MPMFSSTLDIILHFLFFLSPSPSPGISAEETTLNRYTAAADVRTEQKRKGCTCCHGGGTAAEGCVWRQSG